MSDPKPRYKVIDLAPYASPADVNDDSDAALWRAYKNYKKARKRTREEANRALLPKLEALGTLVQYSEYHYAFRAEGDTEVFDLWPSTGKWRSQERRTTNHGGVQSLIRYLRRKGNPNG